MALLEQGGLKGGDISVQLENASGTIINPATEDTLQKVLGFQIPVYDNIYLFPSSAQPTAIHYVYLGTTVAILTLTYSGSDITRVAKTL